MTRLNFGIVELFEFFRVATLKTIRASDF